MANLDPLAEVRPFQYIVTATTDPPQEMSAAKRIVMRVPGTEPSKRAFCRSL
jgi:hypothetical protein